MWPSYWICINYDPILKYGKNTILPYVNYIIIPFW
jgi:hypothetical protein